MSFLFSPFPWVKQRSIITFDWILVIWGLLESIKLHTYISDLSFSSSLQFSNASTKNNSELIGETVFLMFILLFVAVVVWAYTVEQNEGDSDQYRSVKELSKFFTALCTVCAFNPLLIPFYKHLHSFLNCR